ncbi:Porin domain, Gram-negative type [Candidatus Pelagibacterales bacterium]|jgi:hypothetical protein
MKKLMITSALVGTLFAGAASAQTTVSGNLGISYFSVGNDTANKANDVGTFGRESQINISNKGKLNNGFDYVAGFSLEFDGSDSTLTTGAGITKGVATGQQQENVYIDFISGNTTISVGVDHFQNTDAHYTNLVGFGYIGADGVNNTASIYPAANATLYGNWGVGVAQKAAGGQFGLYYTPNATNQAVNDIGNGLTKAATLDNPSGYELTYVGDAGVKGLSLLAGYARADSPSAGSKIGGQRIAAKYNLGSLTLAVDDVTAKVLNTADTDGRSYGVAYAVNKDVSVGVTYAEAKRPGSKDEETVLVALGYNLGPVTVQAQHKKANNVGGTAANDGEITGIYLGTRF